MTTSPTHPQPWRQYYPPNTPDVPSIEFASIPAAYRSAMEAFGARPLICYFDRILTGTEIDTRSDALAAALSDRGVRKADRVALYLQNMPQFVIAVLAAWKLGAVVVPINPMLRARELRHQLADSAAVALVSLDSLYHEVVRSVLGETAISIVVTTAARDMQTRNDSRVFGTASEYAGAETVDFCALLAEWSGKAVPIPELTRDDIAMLTYTSGTTGVPKAATNTHGNLLFNAQTTRDWMALGPDRPILGIAPLFHITGLVCQVVTSVITPAPLVLSYRFEPDVMLDSMREHRPAFAIGAVTAFVALLSAPGFDRDAFTSFTHVFSGGAPVSPAIAMRFEDATGHQLHGAFGMTETTAPTHLAPWGVPARVDPASGALTVGIPTPGTDAWVVDDNGNEQPPGEPGELLLAGPQVVPGYWQRHTETAEAFRAGRMCSGDIAIMDADGWFYIVDRKKDIIIASGYKVWPREVEDVLTAHPAVREAAVVAVPDEYRGESVKAFVSLRPGHSTTPQVLIDFVGGELAAYKRPRVVEILTELPKTATGKIMRRSLRDQPATPGETSES